MLATIASPLGEPRSTIVTTEFGKREVYSFGQAFNPEDTAKRIWVCCLSPDALPDFVQAVPIAQRAAALNRESYLAARAYGAALYRAKAYEAAIKQLETARDREKSPSPSVWLVLAMAHQRQGHRSEAKEWLGKARAWIEETRDRKPDDKSGLAWKQLPWTEQVALEALLAEAEKTIQRAAAKP
jgi:tetratricopeptide (TPR) repeat protein